MAFRTFLIKRLRKLNFIRDWREGYHFNRNSCFPAGHYYSPIVSIDLLKTREEQVWNCAKNIPGLDLRIPEQLELLKTFSLYYNEMPWKAEKSLDLRYKFSNNYYSYTDAIILYSIIRHFKPKRILEIGSGYSSAAMLDLNELFFERKIQFTFIEPDPKRLIRLITGKDKDEVVILQNEVQNVSLEIFANLDAGDILFVDGSHVVKTGSDVNFILFEILPILKKGVLIHFHDIYFPFEYPKEWVYKGLNWNETYILKAFLMYNSQFRIILFSDFLHKYYPKEFDSMPETSKATGSNLWLIKE